MNDFDWVDKLIVWALNIIHKYGTYVLAAILVIIGTLMFLTLNEANAEENQAYTNVGVYMVGDKTTVGDIPDKLLEVADLIGYNCTAEITIPTRIVKNGDYYGENTDMSMAGGEVISCNSKPETNHRVSVLRAEGFKIVPFVFSDGSVNEDTLAFIEFQGETVATCLVKALMELRLIPSGTTTEALLVEMPISIEVKDKVCKPFRI